MKDASFESFENGGHLPWLDDNEAHSKKSEHLLTIVKSFVHAHPHRLKISLLSPWLPTKDSSQMYHHADVE